MQPPKDAKTVDFATSTIWFDGEGVMYSVPKPNAVLPTTREESSKQMEKFREIAGGKKVCMILQMDSSAPPLKKEDRDWIAKELDSVTKAMAIISNSPLSRMIANLFFGLKPPAYPAKFFSNETEAKAWIKQYCTEK